MNIKPISNISYTNNIDFTARKNKKTNNETHNSSPLKKVPLMVFIAMSPLTCVNAQNTDTVTAEQIKHMTYTNIQPVEAQNETIYLIPRSNDTNRDNGEFLTFDYFCKTNMAGRKTQVCMSGIINKISTEKNDDDRYIATYQEIKDGKVMYERICSLPKEFGKEVIKFAKSKQNNGAVQIQTRKELEEEYGISNIEGATPLYELCSTIQLNGSRQNLY